MPLEGRGFESHPLRQRMKEPAFAGSFFICMVAILRTHVPKRGRGGRVRPHPADDKGSTKEWQKHSKFKRQCRMS